MFDYGTTVLRRHYCLLRKFLLELVVHYYHEMFDQRKMRKVLYLALAERIRKCHAPFEVIFEHQANIVPTETLNEGYLSVVGDTYTRRGRKMKRETLQMKSQNRVFLSSEAGKSNVITQLMRKEYMEGHEHDGTIMNTYYKQRVRKAVHSTVIDNIMLKSDASAYAFPLRHDLSQ